MSLIKKNIQKSVKSLLINLYFRVVYGNTLTNDYVIKAFYKDLRGGGRGLGERM
jgi:hypothetical protein